MDEARQQGDEDRRDKLSSRTSNNNRMIQGLALLAVFAVAFLLRAAAAGQPSIEPQNRPCLLDENGDPYLTEMDSYFYLRKAREMADRDAVVWSVDRNEDPMIGQKSYGGYHREVYTGSGAGNGLEPDGEGWTGSGAPDDSEPGGEAGASGARGGVVLPLGISALAFLIWKYLSSPLLGASLTQTAIWMGPVFGSLAVFPAFWYVRRRTCFIGGLAAAILTGCAIPFVLHTHAGFFDTDMVLAVLPLTGILTLIRCTCEKDLRHQTVLALVSAAAFACMSRFWKAYYGYYLFALAGTGVSLLLMLMLTLSRLVPVNGTAEGKDPEADTAGQIRQGGQAGRRRTLRWILKRILWRILRGSILFYMFSILLLLFFNGKEAVLEMIGALAAMRRAMGSTDSMPYALKLIAEMQPLRFLPDGSGLKFFFSLLTAGNRSLVGRLGGLIPCLLAAGWIPAEIVEIRKSEAVEETNEELTALIPEGVFLGAWLGAGVYLTCFRGGRFAELAVLPACILCGLTMGRLWTLYAKRDGAGRKVTVFALSLLLAAAVFPMFLGAWKAVRGTRSYVTDSKQEAMTWIRDNTSPDTALVSWWDDGYFMQYQARRRTLSDGGSDNGKLSWLVAAALTTEDPDLMTGILRMVNESGTEALDDLTYAGMDQPGASRLLLRILSADRADAEEELTAAVGDDPDLIRRILDKTHPEEPDPLVLTLTTDLLQKFRSLGYFGFWNPDLKEQEEEAYILPSSESVLSQREERVTRVQIPMVDPGYELYLESEEDRTGLQTGSSSMEAGKIRFSAFYTDHGEQVIPRCLLIWEDGILMQENVPDREGGSLKQRDTTDREGGSLMQEDMTGQGNRDDIFAAVVVKEGDRFSAVLCTENLCRSMLVRLMVCEDRSLSQAEHLGTWYSEYASDPSRAQQRINYLSWTSWAAQAWEVRQTRE